MTKTIDEMARELALKFRNFFHDRAIADEAGIILPRLHWPELIKLCEQEFLDAERRGEERMREMAAKLLETHIVTRTSQGNGVNKLNNRKNSDIGITQLIFSDAIRNLKLTGDA